MMQGDSYGIPIELLNADGTPIADSDISDVEITIGRLSKRYSDGDIVYDSDNQMWVFPMSQEESFMFPTGYVKVQVRVVWPSGGVEGVDLDDIRVQESISKEVL